MLRIIKEEVKHEHHTDYGMFFLAIMSHGTERNYVIGSDGVLVDLNSVYDLLSPLEFPGMTDKPKLIVIQACGGGRSSIK